MSLFRLSILVFSLLAYTTSLAQKDSVWQTLARTSTQTITKAENTISKFSAKADCITNSIQEIPSKYIKLVDKKIDKYTSRITGKTERTLTKLSKWENKIHSLLQKVSPETANRLFAPDQITFSTLLKQYQEGKVAVRDYRVKYDEYRDKLASSIKYIDSEKDKLESKYVKPLTTATKKLDKLEEDVANTEAVEKFIKERKKQLVEVAINYVGKSKYLKKISKESYYYIETLRNYKEIFSDPDKLEQTAKTILNKIPAFRTFVQKNGALVSLFRNSSSNAAQSLAGLQTRSDINDILQNRLSASGPNARELISQNVNRAKAELDQLKEKVTKAGGSSSETELPDFKPNKQKTKTFLQRLEFGNNIQMAKNNSLLPATTDIAVSVGYKLNDKSIIGIGAAYKLGLGSIEKIRFTHEGIGFRSFVDLKLKKQFFVSGGFELNYNAQFKNIAQLRGYNSWQKSGLIGMSKKINKRGKWFKGTTLQLMFDMMYRSHTPVSQPVLFRTGYSF